MAAVFDLENGGQTVGSLSGTGGAVNLGNGSLTVDQAGDARALPAPSAARAA